jgi:hypothetical protein
MLKRWMLDIEHVDKNLMFTLHTVVEEMLKGELP